MHKEFSDQIKGTKIDGYEIRSEVNFIEGNSIDSNLKGSIRVDALVIDESDKIVAVYDLKTGGAYMSSGQFRKIIKHIDGNDVPVFIVKVK